MDNYTIEVRHVEADDDYDVSVNINVDGVNVFKLGFSLSQLVSIPYKLDNNGELISSKESDPLNLTAWRVQLCTDGEYDTYLKKTRANTDAPYYVHIRSVMGNISQTVVFKYTKLFDEMLIQLKNLKNTEH